MMRNRVTVLQILPGHITEPEARLSLKLAALSAFCSGSVISTASNPQTYRFADFDVDLVRDRDRSRVRDNIKFFYRCLREAKSIEAQSGLDLIVCYDPLKTGLFGVLIKAIVGGRLIVEVNGVYASTVLYQKKGVLNRIKKYIYPRIQQFILDRADAVKYLFDGQLRHLRLKNSLRRYIFFNHTDARPKEYQAEETGVVLSIGFPSYIKGLDLLIEAFLGLTAEFPGWKLVLLGHFGSHDEEKMRCLIGRSNNVELRGPVPFSDIPATLDTCSILVLASRTEAMGRVLLEAMARSKPRIGSNVDGIPSVIEDGVDGLLFESTNVPDLREKLRTLMHSTTLRERMGRAGHARFTQSFTLENYVSLVKNMYFEVAGRKRPDL